MHFREVSGAEHFCKLFTGQYKKKKPKTNSLFNQLNTSRASWLSWKLRDFDSRVPGSNSTTVNSLFLCHFFSQSEDSKKIQCLSHERRWPTHMRVSEVYKKLTACFDRFKKPPSKFLSGIKNLWPKFVLKWALGNRNLHKKFSNILQAEAEKLSGFKTPDNFEAEACNIFKFFPLLYLETEPSQRLSFEEERAVENKSRSLGLLLQLGRRSVKAGFAP